MGEVLPIAQALLRCPSVTPDDAGTIALIVREMSPYGFNAKIMVTPNGTTNLWLKRGEEGPLFVFAGHVDVVPPGDVTAWKAPPFDATVLDGHLIARGAADMKGSVAAAMVALQDFVEKFPNAPLQLAMLITSDEEGDADQGTVTVVEMLQHAGKTIDWCIVGEPSSARVFGDTVKNGRRGSLNGHLVVFGKQGHVAYPEKCINPIHQLAPALSQLTATKWDEGNEWFGPTTFQVSNIHAGVGAVNVVAPTCELRFNLRYSTQWTAASLREKIESVFNAHSLNYQITWQESASPFVTPEGKLSQALSESIQETTGVQPVLNTTGGTSDARFIARVAHEVVEFGPINATIHSINEEVRVADLEALAVIYRRTIERLAGV